MLTVRAPATSANLGPGFDCLGLALDLQNVVRAEPMPAGRAGTAVVEAIGEGAGELATDASNAVYGAVAHVFALRGAEPPALRLRCENRIPLARGLGSSSAALASGLLLGNRLLGEPLTVDELVDLGTELEGHPDNIAPCLLGGVRVTAMTERGVRQCGVRVAAPLVAVLFVPDFLMDTEGARGLLPESVSLGAAVHNISRAALLVAALGAGRVDLLRTATEDRIHQPRRTAIFPGMPRFFAAALDAGAHGAFLSGAGSTVLALASPERAEAVGAAFAETASAEGIDGWTIRSRIVEQGATVSDE